MACDLCSICMLTAKVGHIRTGLLGHCFSVQSDYRWPLSCLPTLVAKAASNDGGPSSLIGLHDGNEILRSPLLGLTPSSLSQTHTHFASTIIMLGSLHGQGVFSGFMLPWTAKTLILTKSLKVMKVPVACNALIWQICPPRSNGATRRYGPR